MTKDELIKQGEELFKMGLFKASRDKEALGSLLSFFDAINKPLTNRNCSGCISKAFYRLRPEIENLKKSEKQKFTFVMSDVKYKLKVPPYRLDSNTVVTNKNLTDDIVKQILEKFPTSWGLILEVVQEAEAPTEENKPTRRKKATKTPTKTEE